jgi:hypothetical protein
MSSTNVPQSQSFTSIFASNLFRYSVFLAELERNRIQLAAEQRHDREQIDAEDAAENERQVKALEAWLTEQTKRSEEPFIIEKGGRL